MRMPRIHVKPGFHIIVPTVPIAPIVSKNLLAIGAIIWISLDRLGRPNRSKRALTQLRLESVNLLWARNSFKMAARNCRAGLAAIYLIVLAVIRPRIERKLRRKHRPEPDLTFFFIFKNRPYAVQIVLYFFSASAASILKISSIFFPNSFNLKVSRTCFCILVRICCRDLRVFALLPQKGKC